MIDTYDTSGQAEADQLQRWSDMERFALTAPAPVCPSCTDETLCAKYQQEYDQYWAKIDAADEERRKRWAKFM
jgi:hypothetical protein